jgi:hypothetical protein
MNPAVQSLSIRLPKDLWRFMKKKAYEDETTMNEIIVALIVRYKKSLEKQLTRIDNIV